MHRFDTMLSSLFSSAEREKTPIRQFYKSIQRPKVALKWTI